MPDRNAVAMLSGKMIFTLTLKFKGLTLALRH
jgi:hypothetical protein